MLSFSRAGEVLFERASGYRDLANGVANTLDTRFQTASAGKAFVGAGIMKLVEEKKLSLSATLDALADFDLGKIDPAITVAQLLSHTSGAPDYFDEDVMEDYADLWWDFPCYRVRHSRDLLFLMTDKPMMFSPGASFHYNNGGFVLLGLVIEAVTGTAFDRYLKQAVFDPCDMARTGYYEMDRLPEGCANSYIWDAARGEYYANIFSVDSKGTGAGGAFTTAGDVRRFWEGLFGGKIVRMETLNEMLAPRADAGKANYGCGIWLKKDGTPFFQGSDPGRLLRLIPPRGRKHRDRHQQLRRQRLAGGARAPPKIKKSRPGGYAPWRFS